VPAVSGSAEEPGHVWISRQRQHAGSSACQQGVGAKGIVALLFTSQRLYQQLLMAVTGTGVYLAQAAPQTAEALWIAHHSA
jgi:hypothetical protein